MEDLKFIVTLNKMDWFVLFTTSLIFMGGICFSIAGYSNVLAIGATLINFLFIVKFYRSAPLFILFVFIFLYTRTFNYYLVSDIPISFWNDFQSIPIITTVLINHTLFIFFLGNAVPSSQVSHNIDITTFFKSDKIIFYVLVLVSVVILIFGMSGETILEGGPYGSNETVEKSTLHEYFILIYLFIILYAPKGFFYNAIINGLFFLYIVKTLLYGGRIEVVQIGLLFFYVKFVFKGKIKVKYVVLIILLGIYFNGVISTIRDNPLLVLEGDIGKALIPANIFSANSELGYISSNEGDVIQSSARLTGLLGTSSLSYAQRGFSFISYIVSPVVPASLLPSYSNLSAYKQDLYRSGGGGLISTYFYVWLGFFGPVVVASFIAFIIRGLYKFKNRGVIIYGMFLLITFPRWLAYNPVFLVKFCLYGVVLYALINFIKSYIMKKVDNESLDQ